MPADNAEPAVSRKSAEKERRIAEQTELQAAQEAQEAILHDNQTALDSISKRVTTIEETQQHDWQTQVQQHDKKYENPNTDAAARAGNALVRDGRTRHAGR